MPARATRFPLFDSLRAIAALSVLVLHTATFAGASVPGTVVGDYTDHLGVGVTIFFVISGFLLYRPFALARLHGRRRPASGPYAWRRLLRIAPAYWVALTVIVLVVGLPVAVTAADLPAYYLFGQIYSGAPGWDFPAFVLAWSVCVEITFYIALPLIALAMRAVPARTRRAWLTSELALLALLYVGAIAFKLLAVPNVKEDGFGADVWLGAILPNYLDQFAIGMALAVASIWWQDRPLPSPLRLVDRRPAVAWALALVLFLIVAKGIGLSAGFEEMTDAQMLIRHELFGLLAAALVLPAVFGDQTRGVVRRILANPVLLWLGLVSYGIYLYQLAVLFELRDLGLDSVANSLHPYLVWPIVALVVTAAIAALSYYLLERPALSLKRFVRDREHERLQGGLVPAEVPVSEAPDSPATATAGPAR